MFNKDIAKSFSLILQIAFCILTPIFLMIIMSYLIKYYFYFDVTLIFIILGIFAGIRNVYYILKNYIDNMSVHKKSDFEK